MAGGWAAGAGDVARGLLGAVRVEQDVPDVGFDLLERHRGVEAPERVAVLAYDELPEPASVNLRRAEKQRAAPRQPYLLEVPAHVLVKRTK